jgi:hypothetical protein
LFFQTQGTRFAKLSSPYRKSQFFQRNLARQDLFASIFVNFQPGFSLNTGDIDSGTTTISTQNLANRLSEERAVLEATVPAPTQLKSPPPLPPPQFPCRPPLRCRTSQQEGLPNETRCSYSHRLYTVVKLIKASTNIKSCAAELLDKRHLCFLRSA